MFVRARCLSGTRASSLRKVPCDHLSRSPASSLPIVPLAVHSRLNSLFKDPDADLDVLLSPRCARSQLIVTHEVHSSVITRPPARPRRPQNIRIFPVIRPTAVARPSRGTVRAYLATLTPRSQQGRKTGGKSRPDSKIRRAHIPHDTGERRVGVDDLVLRAGDGHGGQAMDGRIRDERGRSNRSEISGQLGRELVARKGHSASCRAGGEDRSRSLWIWFRS